MMDNAKSRISIRPTEPYTNDHRKVASEHAKKESIRKLADTVVKTTGLAGGLHRP